jgi:hypothetical protein
LKHGGTEDTEVYKKNHYLQFFARMNVCLAIQKILAILAILASPAILAILENPPFPPFLRVSKVLYAAGC